jgi:hypothetical protein
MAYVDSVYSAGGAASSVISYSALENDFMFILHTRVYGSVTTPTGWTALSYTSTVESGRSNAIFYRRATASEPTSVTVAASTASQINQLIVCRGVDTTTAFDVTPTSRASASTSKGTAPAITPTNDNCLILYLIFPHDFGMTADPGLQEIARVRGSNAGAYSYYTYGQAGSTAVSAHDWTYHDSATHNPTMVTVALRDDGNNKRKGYVYKENPPASPVFFGNANGHLTSTADIDASSVITSLDGTSTTFRASANPGGVTFEKTDRNALGYGSTYIAPACAINASSRTPSIDLETAIVSLSIQGEPDTYKPYSSIGKYVSLGDGTNYRTWKIDASDTKPSGSELAIPVLIEVDGGFENTEFGTVNATVLQGITHWAFAGPNDIAYRYAGVGYMYKLNTMEVVGGSTTFPASMASATECARTSSLRTVANQSQQSDTQYFCSQLISAGNGSVATVWDSQNHAMEWPSAYAESDKRVQAQISANTLGFRINATASCNINFTSSTFNMGNYHRWEIVSGTSTSATYAETGAAVFNGTVTLNDIGRAIGPMTFSGCKEITKNSADISGGCTISDCVDTQSITLTGATQAALQALVDDIANCTFRANNVAVRIEYTGTGNISLSFDGITWTSNTTDIHYNSTNASALTAVMDNGSNATTSAFSGSATGVTISAPTNDLTLTSSETGTLLQIFTTGTQTVIDSTTGTSLVYTHSGETVDIVAQKAGFLPQRQTGIALSGDVSVTFTLVSDPVYDASHGLTYTTDASWDRATNQLTVPTFGPSVRGVYSLLIDSFISQTSLRNTAFNIQMNGPTSMFLVEDAEGASDASIENMTAGGVRYVNSSDTVTAEWAGIEDKGAGPGANTGEYQQVDGSGTTDARATGNFDEIIKVYGDATHGNFDYRGHLVLKYQVNGYREERVDVLDLYGVSSLEPTLYVVSMNPEAINAATGDPAISITVTDHGASPVTWNSKDFSITITDSAGGNSAEDILRELNYNLSLDATYNGKDPFNWPEMVVEEGSNYATLRGIVEGGTGAALKGVRIVQSDGTTPHAGFARFQADDGTYFTPATVAQLSVPNVTAGRIQVYNQTAAALSAWQATTAYAEGDRVLATTGLGSDLGDGTFFVCTTAGTSGGTEPTWDVASDGNTTSDGTVTWTVRPVEFANTTTTTGYSTSWTDGEHFTAGDVIRVRWTDEDDQEILATGVATTEGITTILDTPVTDSVYTSYGIDGSTVTEYSADYPNVQVDVTDPDNVFYLDRFYAWYKYNLTTADGIRNFFGAVSATNTSNITINNSVVDIYFDNTKATSARQGDTIVVQRADGAYPQVTTTSGGGGLGFYYAGIGYSTSSGSGLDTTERNKLLGLRDFNPESDTVEGSLTYKDANRIMLAESAGKVTVSGSTVTFRDQADSKARITATVDENGQRTSVTVDGSD